MMKTEGTRGIVQPKTAVIKRKTGRKTRDLWLKSRREHRHSRLKSQLFRHGRKISAHTISITSASEFSPVFRVLWGFTHPPSPCPRGRITISLVSLFFPSKYAMEDIAIISYIGFSSLLAFSGIFFFLPPIEQLPSSMKKYKRTRFFQHWFPIQGPLSIAELARFVLLYSYFM